MCIDLVGTDYIDRVHFVGRIGSAKTALAFLREKRRAMNNLFKRRQTSLLQQRTMLWYAYMPKDLELWKYIDVNSTPPSSVRID